ncbi:MAG: SDR family NAD(P)-dependent oxidoreductase [Alphaproteobacteria bacterium]|nr:SDR family NAD(P)-dependent oxidoreductase [Alphaproteobacteria bacterium]
MGKATTTRTKARTGAAAGPLAGRHALVTGGNRGIGAAIADRLASLGAGLTLLARDKASLDKVAAKIASEHGGQIATAAADVTDRTALEHAFESARQANGEIAILVNNAGAATSAPFKRTDIELWQNMVDVNLTSVFHCTSLALPAMVEARYGRIVNVASTAGLTGYAYVTAYCAAKHGVVGLTRALALEVARTGVTVNAVCPGYTETDMTARTVANIIAKTGCSEDEARAQLTALSPQGRLIQPVEVASAVAWLALDEQASITGQTIAVAGGEIL